METLPLRLFVGYARRDHQHRDDLLRYTADLSRDGVRFFADVDIVSGSDWEATLLFELNQADIVVFLVTSSFIESNYCIEKELPIAFQRRERGECVVIPVKVEPFDVAPDSPLRSLQWVPSDVPLSLRGSRKQAAWVAVAKDIRRHVDQLRTRRDVAAPPLDLQPLATPPPAAAATRGVGDRRRQQELRRAERRPSLAKIIHLPTTSRTAEEPSGHGDLVLLLRTTEFDASSWQALAATTAPLVELLEAGLSRLDTDAAELATDLLMTLRSALSPTVEPPQLAAASAHAALVRGWLVDLLTGQR